MVRRDRFRGPHINPNHCDSHDKARLIKELTDIEQVYNGNVQEYTYLRVLNNLPEGMVIDHEEVMDDNSIVITVNVG